MQKGLTSVIFIILIAITSALIVGTAFVLKTTFLKTKVEPAKINETKTKNLEETVLSNPQKLKESILNKVSKEDDFKKDIVNAVNALLKNYYAQKNIYPIKIEELRSEFNISDEDLKIYTAPDYYYDSKGSTYTYTVKLNDGEIFEGDTQGINKYLDAAVWVEVDSIFQTVNLYYGITQSLPKDLSEISLLPDLSFFKTRKNPFTGKPYTYIPNPDGTFTVSGTLSDGTEYKLPRE